MATVYIGDIPEDVRQRDVEDFFRDYKARGFRYLISYLIYFLNNL